MEPRGLKPHTHEQRCAIIEQLIPLFQQRFGDNLVAIAADASYARGADRSYSDLEMEVFLRDLPPEGEDRFLQRIVDGMLIEVIYRTVDGYLDQRSALSPDWYLAGSSVLLPIYNEPVIDEIMRRVRSVQHPRARYVALAARRMCEVQETCGKVLNAIEQRNAEGIGLLLCDAVQSVLITLAFLNETPFTTFAAFIREARAFALKPGRFDDLLDVVVQGTYHEMDRLREIVLSVLAGLEQLLATEGVELYDESFDPNVPNKRYE